MANHMSSIGFPLQTEKDFVEYANRAAAEGEFIQTALGKYIRWPAGEGAELWAQVNPENDLIGLNPHFDGSALMRVGLIERVTRPGETELDGAFYGWADPAEGKPEAGTYPFVFDTPNYRTYEEISIPDVRTVNVAAFAHDLQAYANEKDYLAARKEGWHLAPQSFIPSGLFNPDGSPMDPPQAHAIFTGKVLQTAKLSNPVTGKPFHWAMVRTLGGEIDVVADPEVMNGILIEEGIVQGLFWLSGQLRS